MGTTTVTSVQITSPTSIPLDRDVVIEWDVSGEVVGFDVRIGTERGKWDILSCRLGGSVRAVSLPKLDKSISTLYLEFGYIVRIDVHEHEETENILVTEDPIVIRRT